MIDSENVRSPVPNGVADDMEQGDSLIALAQHYLHIILRRKLVVAFILAATVGAGYFWLQQQTPIYRASATLFIDSDPPKIFWNVKDVVELGSPKNYRGQMTYFETQYRVIRSNEVAELVLNRENLWNNEHLAGLDVADPPLTAEEKETFWDKAHMPSMLSGRVKVRPVANSMLVHVDFQDSDPEFAQRIVDAICDAYRDQNLFYKRKIVKDASEDLGKSAAQRKKTLRDAQDAVIAYEAQHNVGSIEAMKAAIDARISKVNFALIDTRTQRIQLEARWASVKDQGNSKDPFSSQSSLILKDFGIRSLKTQIIAVQSELASLKAKYLDKHPEVLSKLQRLKVLNTIARKEIRNIAEAARRDLIETRRVETGLLEEFKKAKAEEREIGTLALAYQRLVDIKEEAKSSEAFVAKRLFETEESAKFEANNVRVMDYSVLPSVPVSPRRGITLVASFLLGCLLAIGGALLLDYADATIKDWRDLEERIGYKVLGVMPIVAGKAIARSKMTPRERRDRDLYIYDHPNSQPAEACRTLRTNLLFMASTREVSAILVTSANPAEGKSLMTSQIAISMASSGSKVLLVEADMRRPRLAESFSVSPTNGLSSCLISKDGSVKDFAQPTEVDNLDIMVCGPVPPNPAELLHTQRFAQVLAEMKGHYDMIIFDSPPILPVSDALVLAQSVDGVITVVKGGQTSRHALNQAMRHLRSVNAPVLGMVLNHLSQKKRGYGQGYGYGYGYGYGGYGGQGGYGGGSGGSEPEATG